MDNYDNSVMQSIDYSTFMNIIGHIPSNIFFKDTELKYRFVSHYWREVNSDDVNGKTDLEIRKDKENAPKAMEADREIIRSGKGCKYVIKSEIDGEVRYLELIKEPIKDDSGKVIGIVGLINDVTEQTVLDIKLKEVSKQLEEQCQKLEATNRELKLSLDKIESMNHAQKMFSASMNHELRTPLNGITGFLQILNSDNSLNAEQHKYVEDAYKSANMMLGIVNDLLDIAKMETSEFAIREDEFSLKEIVDTICNTSANLASSKGLLFETNLNSNLDEYVCGDENRIEQIMNNIISNAIKYTDLGIVKVDLSYEDESLKFICTDTGQGMSKEAVDELFTPFVRFNEGKNKNIQGTGLGMSIVKKIIDKMQGDILVESKINEGTRFEISLPLKVSKSKDVVAVKKQTITDTDKNEDFSNIRVLCVDDTSINVAVFAGLLKHTGIKIDKAYSGEEALVKAKENKYDIIFMDHYMPKMDGVETFKMIRNGQGINKDTPVVVLTANAGKDIEDEYNRIGFNGYLAKPILRDRLIAMILGTLLL